MSINTTCCCQMRGRETEWKKKIITKHLKPAMIVPIYIIIYCYIYKVLLRATYTARYLYNWRMSDLSYCIISTQRYILHNNLHTHIPYMCLINVLR